MQHSDDLQLVARVLAKERAAFDEFFEAYFARLIRFCSARVRTMWRAQLTGCSIEPHMIVMFECSPIE